MKELDKNKLVEHLYRMAQLHTNSRSVYNFIDRTIADFDLQNEYYKYCINHQDDDQPGVCSGD